MTNNKQFIDFLHSITTESNATLIESITSAYNILTEATNKEFTSDFALGDYYTITSQNPKYINYVLSEIPTVIEALQAKGYTLESIKSLDIGASLGEIEGQGYASGSGGSYDEEAYGSMFEDGIDASVSDIILTLDIDQDTEGEFAEIHLDETNNPAIYEWFKDTVEADESVNDAVLADYEGNSRSRYDDSRAESIAASREARNDRMNDRY